jgi:WD40 repeat protein
VGIIRAANLRQVEVGEQAAVDVLVAGLDPGNVLDAMALGEHLSTGSIGRDLEAKSRAYVCGNFPAVSAEQTFLALPVAEVAALVGSDDIAAAEEEVFAGVVRWVKEDEAGRKEALDQLLPLVRFPQMASRLQAMVEPLLAQHSLAAQFMAECLPEYAASEQAAGCPRLKARVGRVDVLSFEVVMTLDGHGHEMNCIGSMPNGQLACGSSDNSIKIWDVATGAEAVRTLEGHEDCVWVVAALPNGQLASGSEDNSIKIWDIATGAEVRTLEGHMDSVLALVTLPNGHLASGSNDRSIKIWDVATGAEVRTLEGHDDCVVALVAVPNGQLASGSEDNSIKIWDVATGVVVKTLEGHEGCVWALVALPNGQLASGSGDHSIRVWGTRRVE